MTIKEKINYLISIGIPIKTIANYCDYNDTHISKYARGLINISDKCLKYLENGINNFIKDIEVIKNE